MIRAAALFGLVFSGLIMMQFTGCAAPGDPSPRRPVVPEKVTDLAARQYGNAMDLTFTLPTRATDREALAEPPAIEIYRAALAPGVAPDRKTGWRLVFTIPPEQVDSYRQEDHVEFSDPFSSDDITRAPGSSFAYNVRTRAAKARASADSNIVMTRVYPPPGGPLNVKTTVREDMIDISWSAPLGDASAPTVQGYRVYREEVEAPPQDRESPVRLQGKTPLTLLGETEATEFQDRSFEFGHTYVYSVRGVARYGGTTVESGQPMGSTALISPRDVFPPAAPTGLEVSVIPATNETPAYVELSWAISPEGDLGGYFVYRSNLEDTLGERISTEILLSPTFRDNSVLPGNRYYYRISAVDRSGNESPKSAAVQADIP
jgi:hypothetical protein